MGDVGSGKTLYTARLLEEAVQAGYGRRTTVIDMAPPTMEIRGLRAGGLLADYTPSVMEVRYLRPREVKAPRLTARTPREVLEYAEFNRRVIDQLLDAFLKEPTPILFVNDLSIYLQAGSLPRIIQVMEKAETFIANCYKGEALRDDLGTGLSRREREAVERLEGLMDLVVRL